MYEVAETMPIAFLAFRDNNELSYEIYLSLIFNMLSTINKAINYR